DLCPAARTAPAAGAAGPGPRRDALDACNALLLRDCDAVVVPTRAVLNRIALPVSDERTFVVPSGVAPRPTTPEHVATFRQRYGIADDDRVVLFVGRINREKGRGLGPAAGRVVWAGEQPADVVAAAYGAAEVFAFPSRTDTQALVLQEAALAGPPPVLADPVLHQYGALAGAAVCAGADPAAFAKALVGLLD